MFFNKLIFTIKESFSGIAKSFSKSVIQFLVCFVSLTFFSFVYGVNLNVQNVAENMRSQIEISIFLKDDISDEDFSNIERKIKSNENVKEFSFKSREEARKEGEELLKDYPEMIDSLKDFDDHPFPSSFTVVLKDVNETASFAEQISSLSGIELDGVKYGEEYMDKIISLSRGLQIGSIFALLFFFVTAVFFMMSIVNVIISAKDKQCKIMYLIGASPTQIKLPFYIQGAFIGLLSSILSYCVFIYSYDMVSNSIGFSLVSIDDIRIQFLIFILTIGGLTGIIATKIALSKFDKLKKVTRKKLS